MPNESSKRCVEQQGASHCLPQQRRSVKDWYRPSRSRWCMPPAIVDPAPSSNRCQCPRGTTSHFDEVEQAESRQSSVVLTQEHDGSTAACTAGPEAAPAIGHEPSLPEPAPASMQQSTHATTGDMADPPGSAMVAEQACLKPTSITSAATVSIDRLDEPRQENDHDSWNRIRAWQTDVEHIWTTRFQNLRMELDAW